MRSEELMAEVLPHPLGSLRAEPTPAPATELSVVVALYNEEESVAPLYAALSATLEGLALSYELVLVDDGSTDGTYPELLRIAAADQRARIIRFRRNFGQTAAMAAGFDHAVGRVIVAMDGDLQNDPRDIPRLLEKLDEGYDIVSGWRKDRADSATRTIPSRVANWLISRVTGVRLHDCGCSLKAYRADVVRDLRLYGEMHRLIPALAHQVGASMCEVPVQHHARRYGKSKYGFRRTIKVLLDLLTVKFFSSFSTKPIYVFGGTGVVFCCFGSLAAAATLYQKYVDGVWVHNNPLLLVAVFLFLVGINLLLLGLIAEMLVRTYHESQAKPIYWVRERINLDNREPIA
jgi:glycosyltransferase involved in cell wall biosynthesis